MLDVPTWYALSQQWPWFAGAAGVLLVAVGLFISLKPNSKRQCEPAATDPESGWTLTGRIDFADGRSVGELVLQTEESRSTLGLTGLEHREIRWRKATVEEAKTVLKSYNAQRNVTMIPTFAFSRTRTAGDVHSEWLGNDSKEAANTDDISDVTLIPQDTQR
jgi:hypothetical protein